MVLPVSVIFFLYLSFRSEPRLLPRLFNPETFSAYCGRKEVQVTTRRGGHRIGGELFSAGYCEAIKPFAPGADPRSLPTTHEGGPVWYRIGMERTMMIADSNQI